MTQNDAGINGLHFTDLSAAPIRGATEPSKSRAREWVAHSSLCVYAVLVTLITMWPTPVDQGFEPSIDRVLDVLHRNGIPEWFGYNKLEFSANVALFVPLGFLVSMLLPSKLWWLALTICPGVSVAIEVVQGAVLSGRFGTVSDVAANSTGALIGAVIALVIRAAVYRRDTKVLACALWQLRRR